MKIIKKKTAPKTRSKQFMLTGGFLLIAVVSFSQQMPNPKPASSGQMSVITSQIEAILGEDENDILGGIKDAVMNAAISAITTVLDIQSPIASVEKLKGVMKDAFSKQQKIQYQQYKVDYEEKTMNTTLSPSFVNYYDKLDLPAKVTDFDNAKSSLIKITQSRVFTATEKQAFSTAIDRLGNVDDLVDEVKTATNSNGGDAAWMSEADRVKVIESARDEIARRKQVLEQFKNQVKSAYVYRVQQAARNRSLSALYNTGSTLNRTLPTTRQAYP